MEGDTGSGKNVKRIPSPDGKKDVKGNRISILPEGTVLQGRYGLSYLTSGGMGVIYKALDRKTDLPCIIKEIVFQASEQAVTMKSFIKEKEMLSKFYHPGIVNLLDCFQENNASYLVLEYVDGLPMDDYIKEKKPSLNKIIYWSLQLCNVLEYLHNMVPPVIYRDLKPENILIDKSDRIKLIDFGIARTYKEDQEKDTEAVGSPGFASPEQYGKKQTDGRSDIYSFGALLHYLLTGLDPREKDKPFLFEHVSLHNKEAPFALEDIVSKTLSLNPDERYQDIREIKKVFEKLSKAYPCETAIPPEDLQEEEIKREKSPGYWRKTLSYIAFDIAVLAVIFLLAIPFTTTAPDYMRGSATEGCSRLNGCESNLKNLATALEMYATDNDGNYPPDIKFLKDQGYIRQQPVCPYSKREYSYKSFSSDEVVYKITEEAIWNMYSYRDMDKKIEEILRPLINKEFSREDLEKELKNLRIKKSYIEEILSLASPRFLMWCTLPESHLPSCYVPREGAYPQYSPSEGIIGGI